MQITKLDFSYIDEIVAKQNSCFSDGWNKDMFLSAKNDRGFEIFGAFIDNKLVGVAYINYSYEQGDVQGIFTSLEYRGKGVASLLMETILQEFKKHNVEKVFLEVRESNDKAIRLYEKFAFIKINVRKRYYSDGENAIIYMKQLV